VSPYIGLNSWNRLSSTKRARISRVSVGILVSRLMMLERQELIPRLRQVVLDLQAVVLMVK